MRFAVLSTLSLITGHLAAGAAVPETEKRDIVLETIIHGDTQEIFDHAPDSVVLQKGDDDIKREYLESDENRGRWGPRLTVRLRRS